MASTVTSKGISEFGKCHVVEVLAEDADSWKVIPMLAHVVVITTQTEPLKRSPVKTVALDENRGSNVMADVKLVLIAHCDVVCDPRIGGYAIVLVISTLTDDSVVSTFLVLHGLIEVVRTAEFLMLMMTW